MLVLSRHVGESIVIMDAAGQVVAEVFLTSILPTGARIGVTAPPEISVWRREIYESIQRQNQEQQAAADA